jgi:hypothetical protein
MERREFLRASCLAGAASLSGLAAAGEPDPMKRLPNESEAAYRTRLARMRAQAAADARRAEGERDVTKRLPGESEAAYRTRMARARAQAAARARAATGATEARDYYELRRYEIGNWEQRSAFDWFAAEAAIPALNRHNVEPVGVFYPWDDGQLSPIYVLLRHQSLASVVMLKERLSEDDEFMERGSAYLNAPANRPAYARMTSSLMIAFEGMKRLETPVKNPGRVLQFRIYESPSVKTGQKKIEMFNVGEIDIFRRTGLHPVFFGETLVGDRMPNLTYMLAFKDMDERKANWKAFGSHSDWKALKSTPGYADKEIVSKITNIFLKPADYSQI